MKWLYKIPFVLLVIGGLNWGLVGLLGLNLVTLVFGSWPMVVNVVYVLVGLSAVYVVVKPKI
jgi:uncharacterized membrane protein YuzA (DUF378 family)